MTFQQMQYFIELAHCKNFTQTAKNLYISQPNLTKYIANMEKELGVRLFERSYHNVELTPAGRQLLQKTETIFFYMMRAINDAKLASKNEVRYINLGISQDESLPKVLREVLRSQNLLKNQSIIIEENTYFSLVSNLLDHTYDLIITTDRNILSRNDLGYAALRRFNLVLAVSKQHPKANEPHLVPLDFQNELVFIALPDGKTVPNNVVSSVYNNCGGQINLFFSNTPRDILLNAEISSGVAIVSGLVDRNMYPGLRFVEFEERSSAYQYLVWRKNESDPDILACRDALLSSVDALPDAPHSDKVPDDLS